MISAFQMFLNDATWLVSQGQKWFCLCKVNESQILNGRWDQERCTDLEGQADAGASSGMVSSAWHPKALLLPSISAVYIYIYQQCSMEKQWHRHVAGAHGKTIIRTVETKASRRESRVVLPSQVGPAVHCEIKTMNIQKPQL